jgi:hypothetical protein
MNKQELEKVKSVVRNIPDFPVPGIQFKDLTTAFKDTEALQIMARAMADLYRDKGVTRVILNTAWSFTDLSTRINGGTPITDGEGHTIYPTQAFALYEVTGGDASVSDI